MGYSVSQTLIAGQPPLLVFTICLTCFGLTMVILAYVVGEQEVPNPDVQMDWNKLFKKISSFKLCPLQNTTKLLKNDGLHANRATHANYIAESVLNSSHVVDESKSMSAVLSNVVNQARDQHFDKSAFTEIAVKVRFGLQARFSPETSFHLKGKVRGKALGFLGKYSSVLFNISLSFRPFVNNSCAEEICHTISDACLIMNLPSDLLPETKSPEKCDDKIAGQEFVPAYFTSSKISDQKDSEVPCLELDYTPNAKLTEMLSLQDRSIVNLHLMHTSYFMFVMVMTLVCYSLIRGRYRHPKNSFSHEKIPLDA